MASLIAIEKAIEAYNERRGLRQAIIAAIDAAAAVDGAAQLSRYSDAEISGEYARRVQSKLGDQRTCVSSEARLK